MMTGITAVAGEVLQEANADAQHGARIVQHGRAAAQEKIFVGSSASLKEQIMTDSLIADTIGQSGGEQTEPGTAPGGPVTGGMATGGTATGGRGAGAQRRKAGQPGRDDLYRRRR